MAELIEVRSPYDNKLIGTVPHGTSADVDAAVRAAHDALRNRPLAQHRRAEILETAARLLGDPSVRERFATLISSEAAKPIKAARVESTRAVGTFTYAAIEARTLAGDMIPVAGTDVGVGKLAFTMRMPIGVVGAITPFNFPLTLVVHKVAPAIAAGCPVVVKPATQTPLTAIALRDFLVNECGLPADYMHVVCGGGSDVGAALVDHDLVAMISFTGSPDVGWGIRAKAPRKRVGLELGNASPIILEPDSDWRRAAKAISVAGFSHAGQSCISTQRIFVHRSLHDQFVDELVGHVNALNVGDPSNEATDVSSLISISERDRVHQWIKEATAAGASTVLGGEIDGTVLQPTIITNATPDMKVCALEVFGPVVAIMAYDNFDDAIAESNNSRYGLQASVWTTNISKALNASTRLEFGGVIINEVPTWRADQMPYGGLRDSGNTREGPRHAVHEMTEERLVVVHTE
jgi:acyl-CoA reductase-like NAD-dependent aldehyde dehydrogenase